MERWVFSWKSLSMLKIYDLCPMLSHSSHQVAKCSLEGGGKWERIGGRRPLVQRETWLLVQRDSFFQIMCKNRMVLGEKEHSERNNAVKCFILPDKSWNNFEKKKCFKQTILQFTRWFAFCNKIMCFTWTLSVSRFSNNSFVSASLTPRRE